VIYSRAIRFNRTEFALVLGIAFGLLILLSVGSLFVQQHSATVATSQLVQLLSYELIVGTGVALILRHNGWRLPHFNLYPSLGATGAGLLLAVGGAILLYACNWVVAAAVGPTSSVPVHPYLTLAAGSSSLLVATVCLVNPLFEEMLLAGYVVGSLRRRYGMIVAINFSALLRVAVHLDQSVTAVLWIGLMGLLFGYVYAYTRRLWPLVVAHMTYDFVVLTF
jgi:membrane protease YdiL (CAAX protease family)